MTKELRQSIIDILGTLSQVEYVKKLFDLEDADEAAAIEYGARVTALEYAARLSDDHKVVVIAANAYSEFLSGNSETNPMA